MCAMPISEYDPTNIPIANSSIAEGLNKKEDKLNQPTLQNWNLPDLTGLYFKDAIRQHPIPLLTHAEEINLAQTIERGNLARKELRHPRISNNRRHMLSSIVATANAARETLIVRNLRLVVSIANKYSRNGIDLIDLIQDGNAGLIKAAEKYDWRKGTRFSTYATWWIRQEVTRSIDKHSRTIRIPTHMCQYARRLPRVRDELVARLKREPSDDELAAALEISPKKLKAIYNGIRQPYSLESSEIHEDESSSPRIELVEDPSCEDASVIAEKNILKQELYTALDSLSLEERDILERRYGLNGYPKGTSQRKIAQALNLSQTHIQRLERSALKKLRSQAILDRLS